MAVTIMPSMRTSPDVAPNFALPLIPNDNICKNMTSWLSGPNGTQDEELKNAFSMICGGPVDPLSADFDAVRRMPYSVIIIVLYVLVVVFGTVGNSLVVITVAKTKTMWNATNIFIAYLALCDILVCGFVMPLNAYYLLAGEWIFGKVLCHVILWTFGVVVYASVLTLMVIAIDRYILLVHPMKKKMSVKVALVLEVVIALLSAAIASPIAIYAQYMDYEDELLGFRKRLCAEKWPNSNLRTLYSSLTLVFHFILPIIVIAIMYFQIFRTLQKRLQKRQSRKTRTTKMLVAVVAVFVVTCLPFEIFSLILEIDMQIVSGEYFGFIDLVLRAIALSSSCINPILYGWLNENFKNAFLGLLKRDKKGQPNRLHRRESESSCEHRPSPGSQLKLNGSAQSKTKATVIASADSFTLKDSNREDNRPAQTANGNECNYIPLVAKV